MSLSPYGNIAWSFVLFLSHRKHTQLGGVIKGSWSPDVSGFLEIHLDTLINSSPGKDGLVPLMCAHKKLFFVKNTSVRMGKCVTLLTSLIVYLTSTYKTSLPLRITCSQSLPRSGGHAVGAYWNATWWSLSSRLLQLPLLGALQGFGKAHISPDEVSCKKEAHLISFYDTEQVLHWRLTDSSSSIQGPASLFPLRVKVNRDKILFILFLSHILQVYRTGCLNSLI